MIFEPFGTIHQILILTVLLIITSFYVLRNKINKQIQAKKTELNNSNKPNNLKTLIIKQKTQEKTQEKMRENPKKENLKEKSILINKNIPNSVHLNLVSSDSIQFFDFPIIRFIFDFLIFGLFGHCLFYFGGHILRGSFNLTKYLPLHICNLPVYLLLIALISLKLKKKWARSFVTLVYYWSLIPASLAFLFPDLQSRFILDFEFVEFFWSHFLIIVSCFFLFFFANLQTKYNFVLKAIGILMIFGLVLIYPLNLILGSNYMYLNRLTETGPMSFFPKPPFHLGVFAGLLLVFYSLQFGLLKLDFHFNPRNRNKRK